MPKEALDLKLRFTRLKCVPTAHNYGSGFPEMASSGLIVLINNQIPEHLFPFQLEERKL